MTAEELMKLFDKHSAKYLTADIEGPRDLAAFNLLNKLVPGKSDIISDAIHDEFFLSVNAEDLARVATEEDVIFLTRCGVRPDGSGGGFAMFA